MATPVKFPSANTKLLPPKGEEETIQEMHVYRFGNVCVSKWKLDPQEIEEVNRTGCIFLSIFSTMIPAVYLGSEDNVRSVCVDYAPLWKK